MKVVLLENISGLGRVGDKKEVASGYAQNYLLPNKLAVRPDDMRAKIILKNISKRRDIMQKDVRGLEKIAEKYKDKEVVFNLKSSNTGKLYGSVGPEEIAEKLKIDKKQINFKPIRQIGEYKVEIDLGHNIKTSIKIIINSKK